MPAFLTRKGVYQNVSLGTEELGHLIGLRPTPGKGIRRIVFVMSYRIVSVLNFKLFLLKCEIMEEFYRKKK